jgi:alcohol dehydrogenase class IV
MINSTDDLNKFIIDKSFNKIFILCGKKSFITSGAEAIFRKILTKKNFKLFYKNSELPILEELILIIKNIREFKPDLILAIGGGAVIDYAKIANVVDVRPDLEKLIINYSYPFKKKYTQLAVIPTTAGSGAEVTSNAVIYVDGIKHSFESELLIPDNFFLIPEFLISAPNKIKASAGFDAIAQALESLVSKKSNAQSVDYATRSLKISVDNYLLFLKEPNLKNATEMSIAANLAGKAISISKTTVPHAVSYPFTSLFNISHGHAVSLFFEDFFKFNHDRLNNSETSFDLKKRFRLIFELFNVSNINNFKSKIIYIKNQANLECDLTKLNINVKKNSEKIIKGINLLRLGNNPIKIDERGIYEIISSTQSNLNGK